MAASVIDDSQPRFQRSTVRCLLCSTAVYASDLNCKQPRHAAINLQTVYSRWKMNVEVGRELLYNESCG